MREIGQQLGVAHFLEGSVQKVANAVHVNVQLIRAATAEHLWAESYNRKLDDVFGVEGEVASAIAEQLNAKLTGAEQKAVAEKPTQNAAAYDVYLRAVAIDNALTLDTTKRAADLYAEAVRLDPQFALAWARLAVARSQLYFNGIDLDNEQRCRGEGGRGSGDVAPARARGSMARPGRLSLPGPARFPRRTPIVRRGAQAFAKQCFRASADGSP